MLWQAASIWLCAQMRCLQLLNNKKKNTHPHETRNVNCNIPIDNHRLSICPRKVLLTVFNNPLLTYTIVCFKGLSTYLLWFSVSFIHSKPTHHIVENPPSSSILPTKTQLTHSKSELYIHTHINLIHTSEQKLWLLQPHN